MTLPPDDAMPFLLLAGFRQLVDEVHEELAQQGFPGVRAAHGFALQAVGGGCSSVELARRLGVSKQAAAKTVQGLEELGFVARRANPNDARERIVVLTPRGRRMLRLSGEAFRSAVGRWRERSGDSDVDATMRLLSGLGGGGGPATDLSLWSLGD